MFLYYTANYLRILEARMPAKFAEYFGPGSKNRQAVIELTMRGEKFLQRWFVLSRRARGQEHAFEGIERGFLEAYEKLKEQSSLWPKVEETAL